MPEVTISWEELNLLEGVREQVEQNRTLTLSPRERQAAQRAITKLAEHVITDAEVDLRHGSGNAGAPPLPRTKVLR